MMTNKEVKGCYAHRAIFMLHHQINLSSKICVCHTCDNKLCCNPDHLWLGTSEDNMKDMKDKKRASWGDRSAHARFTNDQVRMIRKRHQAGTPMIHLAEEFDVAKSTMSYIVNYVTYPYA